MRRRYVSSTSVRRHVPAGNLAIFPRPHIVNLGPPNIQNLPTPMYKGFAIQGSIQEVTKVFSFAKWKIFKNMIDVSIHLILPPERLCA